MATDERRTLSVIRRLGVVRAADLEEEGIPRRRLYALLQKGKVERQARGLYAASNHPRTADHALAQVAKRRAALITRAVTSAREYIRTRFRPAG